MTDWKDPRGPVRNVLEVIRDPGGGWTRLRLSCGHIANVVQHFCYDKTETHRCVRCTKDWVEIES